MTTSLTTTTSRPPYKPHRRRGRSFEAFLALGFVVIVALQLRFLSGSSSSLALLDVLSSTVYELTPPAAATSNIPILPIQRCERYTTRETSGLEYTDQSIAVTDQPVSFSFLKGNKADLKPHNLYPFQNYLQGFEGGVSYAWISLLQSIDNKKKDDYMVLDGGMNTGFYTTLTAAMGVSVHAFELQRDCFDVVQGILESNSVNVQDNAHLYNIGISNEVSILQASEGCDPGYSIIQSNTKAEQVTRHAVVILPLDLFLNQLPRPLKKVALLKLDVEGAEIPALRGLVQHLDHVDNIVVEFAPAYANRFGISKEDATHEFQRLQRAGFVPYKLWSYFLASPARPSDQPSYLSSIGLEDVALHPISKIPITDTTGGEFRKVWKITDWNKFMEAGWKGCNIWFTKME